MQTHSWIVTGAVVAGLMGVMTSDAAAISVEVARKCDALAAKAFPSRVPGNPAAGLEKGTPQAEREYFRKCLQSGGRMDTTEGRGQKNGGK
jgi:hypothetical protein